MTEQHNVDCDWQAKDYVWQWQPPSTLYGNPAFTAARPHLCINGKIICCDFLPTLWHTMATPEYWEYLKKRYHWTHADIENIHWKSLQTALESFQRNDQRQLILFMHGKLPLWTSKFHPHTGLQLCPLCQKEPEDYWHFLECTHLEKCCLFNKLIIQLPHCWQSTTFTQAYWQCSGSDFLQSEMTPPTQRLPTSYHLNYVKSSDIKHA